MGCGRREQYPTIFWYIGEMASYKSSCFTPHIYTSRSDSARTMVHMYYNFDRGQFLSYKCLRMSQEIPKKHQKIADVRKRKAVVYKICLYRIK